MTTGSTKEVRVSVLTPFQSDPYRLTPTRLETLPPFSGLSTFYHPASGVVILGIDWMVFGTDLITGFLALPLLCIISFIVSFRIIYAIQVKWAGDASGLASKKAFLGAFLVALPFPITGTLLGAAILALAGLPHHPVDALKKLVEKIGIK
jgi:hypothetical protein